MPRPKSYWDDATFPCYGYIPYPLDFVNGTQHQIGRVVIVRRWGKDRLKARARCRASGYGEILEDSMVFRTPKDAAESVAGSLAERATQLERLAMHMRDESNDFTRMTTGDLPFDGVMVLDKGNTLESKEGTPAP